MYCVQCGKKNNDNAKFCTGCGAKFATDESVEASEVNTTVNSTPNTQRKIEIVDQPTYSGNTGKSSKIKGIIASVIAVIGIIAMFAENGWTGLFIYLIAAAISLFSIQKEDRQSFSAVISYIKDTCKHISTETLFTNDIFAIILALLPIVVVVAFFVIFYVDPVKEYENQLQKIDDQYNQFLEDLEDLY